LDDLQNAGTILSDHGNLVDEGLLALMATVAIEAQKTGANDIAWFITNIVEQLGAALGIGTTEKSQNNEEEPYVQFLMDLLQTVSDSGGIPRWFIFF
jgi:hypothetical protein